MQPPAQFSAASSLETERENFNSQSFVENVNVGVQIISIFMQL